MNKKNRIFRSNTCIYEKKVLPLQSFLKKSLLLTLGMMMLNHFITCNLFMACAALASTYVCAMSSLEGANPEDRST